MTIDEVKEYLNRGRRLNELIESDLRELERLKLLAISIRGTDWERERVSGGGGGSEVEGVVMKICELEEKINSEVDGYVDTQNEIRAVIDKAATANERLLLQLRYINFLSWEKIAEKMGYSLSGVHRLHGRVLKNLQECIEVDC